MHIARCSAVSAVVLGSFVLASGCSTPAPGVAPLDASTDVKLDVKVPDATGDAPLAINCVPGDVSSFAPQWVAPIPASKACTQPLIDQYAADCIDDTTSSTAKCQAFDTANKACAACLVTPESASAYGPVIAKANNVLSLNVGGCLALTTGDVTAAGCGAKYEATGQCADLACDTNCPLPDGDSVAFQAYLACLQKSQTTVCKTYASADCPEADAGPSTACALSAGSFVDNFKLLAPVFCAAP
ncbi:MAG TPA: hypothetical protein VF316_02345 [Polyangiaceae bacterium]